MTKLVLKKKLLNSVESSCPIAFSVYELPQRGPITDDPERKDENLLTIVPRDRRKVYKMRTIVESVLDQGSFFEMGKNYGRSVITGLARLDGWPVAVMAGDPMHYGGSWTADASQKVVRFVDFAETFHLPVVHLVENPGFLIGTEAEKAATIRHGSRAMAAVFPSFSSLVFNIDTESVWCRWGSPLRF